MIYIIVAMGKNRQIGLNNKMPWFLKGDLENFKKLTSNNVIIMGRKTFESISKILENRINVIITKNKNYKIDGGYVFNSLDEALKKFKNKNIFICGGEKIYQESLEKLHIDKLYITEVDYDGEADTFFPKINYDNWELIEKIDKKKDNLNNYNYTFKVYKNIKNV